MRLEGKVTDYGDVVKQVRYLVKGRRHTLVWHIGAPADSTPADRVATTAPGPPINRKDISMDLLADKKVRLTLGYADEGGNAVPAPDGATATFTVDNPNVIALTDEGNGYATAAATGSLGSAVVTATVEIPGEGTKTGDLLITVVPGLAERITITAGEPEEVTPDEDNG